MRHAVLVPAALSLFLAGCPRDTPPEPTKPDTPATVSLPTASPNASSQPVASATATTAAAPIKPGGDPVGGKFSLDDATKDIKGSGALLGKIETSMGTFT